MKEDWRREEWGVGILLSAAVWEDQRWPHTPLLSVSASHVLSPLLLTLLLCYPSLLFTRGFRIFIYSLKYKYKMENLKYCFPEKYFFLKKIFGRFSLS